MQLTKFTHSCVRIEDGDRALVLDPGAFSEFDAAMDGAQAVLITHEHADHLDADKLRAALARDPSLRVWAPASVVAQLGDLGEQVVAAEPGQAFEAAGFPVRAFGGQHAVIHPSIPTISNVGYLVGDAVYHPGDSFFVPPAAVSVLLLPLHAPWSKMAEVIDFAISVRAPQVRPIHDALLNDLGRGVVEMQVGRLVGEHGSDYAGWAPSDTLTA
ncbi:MAG: MBL fold metallo-hydrolase [Jatrophihabitans sp.]|uniref:MBL fold metallo-hydrolase n=1 Tax=Jatrophihabitans sp. TaxID=1932789 RepID=UPI003F7D1628